MKSQSGRKGRSLALMTAAAAVGLTAALIAQPVAHAGGLFRR